MQSEEWFIFYTTVYRQSLHNIKMSKNTIKYK